MNTLLQDLEEKRLIWHAGEARTAETSWLATGFSELDGLFGGWPENGVIALHGESGCGELRLLNNLFNALSEDELLVFINPPFIPNAAWLAAQGLDLSRILVLPDLPRAEALWAAEQCLKSGVCGQVLFWCNALSVAQLKRFNLACEKADSRLVLLRPALNTALSLPVALSLSLQAEKQGLRVRVLKQQGCFKRGQTWLANERLWPELMFSRTTPQQNDSSLRLVN